MSKSENCRNEGCENEAEVIATSPRGSHEFRLCMDHGETAEEMSWTVTDLEGQEL